MPIPKPYRGAPRVYAELDDRRGMAKAPLQFKAAVKETSMKASRNRRRALLLSAVLAVVISIGGYAFTASNTVPNASLGQGSNTISGYTVSSVAYNLNASNPG